MKRKLSLLLILTFGYALFAQGVGGKKQEHHPVQHRPTEVRHTVNFESRHGETFTVFIDGLPVNRMPQTRVIASEVSSQEHEVVVVLKRPAERVAVLSLRPGERNVEVGVNYDGPQERLFLYTAAINRGRNRDDYDIAQSHEPQHEHPKHREPRHEGHPPAGAEPEQAKEVSEEQLSMMILEMRNRTFSDDRLALGKSLVVATPMRADQIKRLAATLDYSSNQVEFLKYAYDYCTDPKNYHVAIEVLTFSSDRRKLQDYIATR